MSKLDLKSIISEILNIVSDDVRAEAFNIEHSRIKWGHKEHGMEVDFSDVCSTSDEKLELLRVAKRVDDRLGLNQSSCFNEAKKTISLSYRQIEVLKKIYIPQPPKVSVDEKPSIAVKRNFLRGFFNRNQKPKDCNQGAHSKKAANSLVR